MKKYIVGTDGLCKNNQAQGLQKGTWAFVVFDGNTMLGGQSGHSSKTTNNEMEAVAVLKALQWANKYNSAVTIHSDSNYVVQAITQWSKNWLKNGWKTSKGEPVANAEVFKEILAELRPYHHILWVKGHAGNPINEAADMRCNEEYLNAFI